MGFNPDKEPISDIPLHFEELNAADLEEARRLAADPAYSPDRTSLTQAENMARFAQIDLSPEEVRLYSALRDQESPAMNGRVAAEGETGTRASGRSDQKLLAAVLSGSGNEGRLRRFMGSYPNIFS